MSSLYNTPWIKHKLVVSIYSNTETSLAIWCRVVRSRDVRSRDFSVPIQKRMLTIISNVRYPICSQHARQWLSCRIRSDFVWLFNPRMHFDVLDVPARVSWLSDDYCWRQVDGVGQPTAENKIGIKLGFKINNGDLVNCQWFFYFAVQYAILDHV